MYDFCCVPFLILCKDMGTKRNPIKGEEPFQIIKHRFMISNCADEYTLQVSADYVDGGAPEDYTWSDYSSAIPANSGPHEVGPVASGLFWRLKDNTSKVYVVC